MIPPLFCTVTAASKKASHCFCFMHYREPKSERSVESSVVNCLGLVIASTVA